MSSEREPAPEVAGHTTSLTTLGDGERASAPRRAWSAPRITYREPLEAVAATCTGPSTKATPPPCSPANLSS